MKKAFKSVSLYLNVNERTDAAVFSDRFTRLFGPERLKFKVEGIAAELHPSAFFQVNLPQTIKIYKKAAALIAETGAKRVIDCFSGIGMTGLFFAKAGASVTQIEIDPFAAAESKRLAKENGLSDKMEIVNADVSEALPDILKNSQGSAIFLDPPRAGLGLLAPLIGNSGAKAIVYLSCNPVTLAEDLKILKEKYEIKLVAPYDMFPETRHLETLISLQLGV